MDVGLEKVDARGKNILLIGDSHLPYEHPDYLHFCAEVKNEIKADLNIHLGDYEDQHAISFHDSDCELFSAGHELELVIEKTEAWKKEFEYLHLLESNHGSLVFRRLKKHGIPIRHMKTPQEIYDTPNWLYYEDILLSTDMGDLYLHHGKSAGYNRLATQEGCCAVQGHFHTKFEITWVKSRTRQRFNMFVGCGVNHRSLAMAYGRNNIPVPQLGCGAIMSDGMPRLYRMHLDTNGRWIGKL